MLVRIYLALFVLVFMTSCSTMHHGTFVKNFRISDGEIIAGDVTSRLKKIYPPAQTTLSMQYAQSDQFGELLTNELRQAGYAVEAFLPNFIVSPDANTKKDTFPESATGHQLTYVLDQHEDIYRVLIRINDDELTRAYLSQADKVIPAGEWVQKKR